LSGHGHDHHHGHSHAPADFGRAFLVGVVLNVGFVVVEAAFGIVSNSMALLADAGHNLSDVLGLLLAWGAATLSKRAPTQRFTYGLGKTSVLAALFNALFLVLAIGAVAFAAIQRLGNPPPVPGLTVMAVAAAGVAINGITACLFASGRKGDINMRAAFQHMAGDAAVSAGVIVAGFIIFETGWLWVDPIVSLVIVGIIFAATWGLLRDSVAMSLDGVPPEIEPSFVEASLIALPGVARVHNLHIWPVSTTEFALTCHLVMPVVPDDDAFLSRTAAMLRTRHDIHHSTIQIERGLHDHSGHEHEHEHEPG
jgi:cobalt-zinc-cadmium efflux system protein